MRQVAEELYQEVFDVGGTISGEHAYGLSRTPFLARQVGPLYDVLRRGQADFRSREHAQSGQDRRRRSRFADTLPAAGLEPDGAVAAAAAQPPEPARR